MSPYGVIVNVSPAISGVYIVWYMRRQLRLPWRRIALELGAFMAAIAVAAYGSNAILDAI